MTSQLFETLEKHFACTIVSSFKTTKMTHSIQLAVLTDDILTKTSLETFLAESLTIDISFLAKNGETFANALQVMRNPKVDVILVDIGDNGISKLEDIKKLQGLLPDASIIVINATSSDERIFKALHAGVVSCLSKSTPVTKIEEAITTTYQGGSYISPTIARQVLNFFSTKKAAQKTALTNRQLQIIEGVVDGLSYKMIADKLLISIDTVRHHIKTIYRQLNINSKAELIKKSYEQEFLVA